MGEEIDKKQFLNDFNSKLPEHIHYIRGYLDAINRLTQRNGYERLFWINIFNYPEKSKIDFLNEELKITNEELKITIEKLEPLERFIGDIERNVKGKLYKYFLGDDCEKDSEFVSSAIEFLTWDVAEYIDWLVDFTYSCIVEKATIKLKNDDKSEIYCFSLNQEYLVVFAIIESKIIYSSDPGESQI